MDLPPELRLWIYRDLLQTPNTIIKIEHRTKRKETHRLCTEHARLVDGISLVDKFSNVGLLLVSKQLHEEAAPVLYNSKFGFEGHAILNEFVRVIGSMHPYVKHLSIALEEGWDSSPLRSRRLNFNCLTNLRVLRLIPGMQARQSKSLDVDLRNVVANIAPALRAIYATRLDRGEGRDKVVSIARFDSGLCPICMGRQGGDRDREQCYVFEQGTTCEAVRAHSWTATIKIRAMLEAQLTNGGR